MTSASSLTSLESRFYQAPLVHAVDRWLHAMPHPGLVVEIAAAQVAAARWGSVRGTLEATFVEVLPAGSVMPSPVESNIAQPEAVRSAVRSVLSRLPARGAPVALLIPDPVVRVFILPFETLPRRAGDALPMLRWRLKKSVPFDVEEAEVSWMRQSGRGGGLQVVTAIARQKILREYEEIAESAGARVGLVLSSTLAVLPLLDERGSTLLARLSGRTLTTGVVDGRSLCVYRSTEMPGAAENLRPQAMLDEVFPAVAYYQDGWGANLDRAILSGFGEREGLFREALARELKIHVTSLAETEEARGMASSAREILQRGLDSLAGWALNRGR